MSKPPEGTAFKRLAAWVGFALFWAATAAATAPAGTFVLFAGLFWARFLPPIGLPMLALLGTAIVLTLKAERNAEAYAVAFCGATVHAAAGRILFDAMMSI